PPGPTRLPVLGNLLDVPKTQDGSRSWKYSDIISLDLMGDTVIVLNSVTSVDALLEDRSAIYSDRFFVDSVGFRWHFAFMRYGPQWKTHRKVFMQQFQPSEALFHRPSELEATRVLLQRLLDSPGKFERHLRHMAGMVILSTAYGIDIQPEDDPHIDISEKALHAMACTGNRGSYLVDSLPFLKYLPDFFPGAGFKKQAREWYKVVSAMPEIPYNFVKRSLTDVTAKSSIASRVLDEIDGKPDADDQEEVLKNILGACYAGADTTVSALGTFILAMTMYPDVQKKAQAAVDDVVGTNRLPDFNDTIRGCGRSRGPRWRPVTPLAVAHTVTQDDVYKGYHIQAGSLVVGNTWALLHDEAAYGPDTDKFIPERWLTADGKINPAIREPTAAFGFGRRISPGRDMAQWSVWICAASILAMFNISKSVDKAGVPIEPSGEYTSGFLCYPLPHKCDVVPRSEAARVMIQSALEN
ncbi:cytochrome P450, partial [Mycena latifolia]